MRGGSGGGDQTLPSFQCQPAAFFPPSFPSQSSQTRIRTSSLSSSLPKPCQPPLPFPPSLPLLFSYSPTCIFGWMEWVGWVGRRLGRNGWVVNCVWQAASFFLLCPFAHPPLLLPAPHHSPSLPSPASPTIWSGAGQAAHLLSKVINLFNTHGCIYTFIPYRPMGFTLPGLAWPGCRSQAVPRHCNGIQIPCECLAATPPGRQNPHQSSSSLHPLSPHLQ